MIPVLLVVAIGGYLLGIHRGSTRSSADGSDTLRVASATNLLLEYPAGWQPSGQVPHLAGLALTGSYVLAPHGRPATAGLLSGGLPGGEASPLPSAFLALVHGAPHVEVVSLAHLQAYRFSQLSGYERILDVYVVPTAGGTPTALVCYATSAGAGYLQQCEQIVATATLVGETSFNLSPDAGYASQLKTLIETLAGGRTTLRREIRASSAPARLSSLASRLAGEFASAATRLASLEAPQAASAAQAALTTALMGAHAAYLALSAAAAEESPAAYSEADEHVNGAEASVDTALRNFALLGYNHT
ncbi:MAG: hypothetical protein ACRDJX_00410 [Solirubrobacteraceae bacterium]